MKKRLFTDINTTPSEALLRKHLGSAMQYYTTIMDISGEYRKQWQYNRGNGWIQRVDDMRRTLFYLIAFEEGVEISLSVRDEERTAFLTNKECANVFPQIADGVKYSEGYALRFEVESSEECKAVTRFLSELMKLRPVSKMLTDKQKTRINVKESKYSKALQGSNRKH
jgi:hypothetical protein